MKKILVALAFPLSLSACGGGDDAGAPAAPSKFAVRVTYSGLPLIKSKQASRMAAVDAASAADSAGDESAGQATVDALQKKFAAAGTGITVYPGVIDGTTLHQLVMAVNNGVGPTQNEMDHAKLPMAPSEWVVLNFQLDDMQTGRNDPAQAAAIEQFRKDITVFQNRLYLEGKQIYTVLPIRTCELPAGQTAADGLSDALRGAPGSSYLLGLRDAPDRLHMGPDCRTPDQATLDAHMDAIVTPVVASYNAVNEYVNDCRAHPENHPEGCQGL